MVETLNFHYLSHKMDFYLKILTFSSHIFDIIIWKFDFYLQTLHFSHKILTFIFEFGFLLEEFDLLQDLQEAG